MNPKQLQAALNLGMSEREAAMNVVPVSAPLSSEVDEPRIPSTGERKRCESAPAEKPRRSASGRGYKPGDAAKRNAAHKRRSLQPQPLGQSPPQGKLLAVSHGFHTTYEREPVPGAGIPAIETKENVPDVALQRPHLKPHDRHNWAQESQCGDDMRHFFRHSGADKSSTEHHEGDGQYAADAWKPTRSNLTRQKSASVVPENLITEAVKHIRKEEKAKRRRSIVGFFWRGSRE